MVNQRPMRDYFVMTKDRSTVLAPLKSSGKLEGVDVVVQVHGGGSSGQAGAIRLGIARALMGLDTGLEANLRQGSFLTRDGRMKERKKYGLRGARRGTQFSKR